MHSPYLSNFGILCWTVYWLSVWQMRHTARKLYGYGISVLCIILSNEVLVIRLSLNLVTSMARNKTCHGLNNRLAILWFLLSPYGSMCFSHLSVLKTTSKQGRSKTPNWNKVIYRVLTWKCRCLHPTMYNCSWFVVRLPQAKSIHITWERL